VEQGACSALAELVEAHTGQFLQSSKGLLFQTRLASLAYRTGYDDVDELVSYLVDQKPGSNLELQVVTALLDQRSRFVSERLELLELFERVIQPGIKRAGPNRYRIWSAGCGSGQEPCSLQMLLNNHLAPTSLQDIEIVATDISDEALFKAGRGIFSHFDVQMGLSAHNLVKYFTRLGDGDWQISQYLTRRISFRAHNLLSTSQSLGQFDLVVCRNVLGSMTAAHRELAQRNLEKHLRPGADLLVQN
jgi:chemotaxis protein methyltransferase CheR